MSSYLLDELPETAREPLLPELKLELLELLPTERLVLLELLLTERLVLVLLGRS